jgi:hypothetical protein
MLSTAVPYQGRALYLKRYREADQKLYPLPDEGGRKTDHLPRQPSRKTIPFPDHLHKKHSLSQTTFTKNISFPRPPSRKTYPFLEYREIYTLSQTVPRTCFRRKADPFGPNLPVFFYIGSALRTLSLLLPNGDQLLDPCGPLF